jgi:nucleoprotein TPR
MRSIKAAAEEAHESFTREISSLKEQLHLSEELKNKLATEATNYDKKYDEVNQKYKDQLRETVAAIDRLDVVVKENEDLKSQLRSRATEVATLTEKISATEETLRTTKNSLESQLQQAQVRLREAHELVDNQMSKLLNQSTQNIENIVASTSAGISQNTEARENLISEYQLRENTIEGKLKNYFFVLIVLFVELREVVQYLRNERKILDQRLDVAEKETSRWRQQADHCLRARDEAHALLRKEQERSRDGQLVTEAEYRAQQEQLRQLNLLKESNLTLREQVTTRTQELGL